MSMNVVVIVGRVVRRPECRYTPGGDPVCDLSVAVNEKTKQGEKLAGFFDCVVWGPPAEACAKHLDKGDLVAVQGKLQQQRWEKDGQKRSKVVIRAWQVEFLRVAAWGQADGGGESQESRHRPEDEDQSRGGDVQEQGEDQAVDQDEIPF